jgi:hypothetical protein
MPSNPPQDERRNEVAAAIYRIANPEEIMRRGWDGADGESRENCLACADAAIRILAAVDAPAPAVGSGENELLALSIPTYTYEEMEYAIRNCAEWIRTDNDADQVWLTTLEAHAISMLQDAIYLRDALAALAKDAERLREALELRDTVGTFEKLVDSRYPEQNAAFATKTIARGNPDDRHET